MPILIFSVAAVVVIWAVCLAPSTRSEKAGLLLVAEAIVSMAIWECFRPSWDKHFPEGYFIGFPIAIMGVCLMFFGEELEARLKRFRN